MTPREGQKKAVQDSNQRTVHPQALAATGESEPIFQSLKGEETNPPKKAILIPRSGM